MSNGYMFTWCRSLFKLQFQHKVIYAQTKSATISHLAAG